MKTADEIKTWLTLNAGVTDEGAQNLIINSLIPECSDQLRMKARLRAFEEALSHYNEYSTERYRRWLTNSINLIKLGS
jgi:hypothetical protein